MKLLWLLFAGIYLTSCSYTEKASNQYQQEDVTKYVDLNLSGTHNKSFFFTPAVIPFGLVKLAPHTNAFGSNDSLISVGYSNKHTSIEGFGHFHELQIGGLVVMPTTGKLVTLPGSLDNPDSGYRSRFNKEEQIATTGYYAVNLKDYNIKAELTATEHVGFHRYTFPASSKAHILLDIGHKQKESSEMINACAKMVSDTEVEGFIETYPDYSKFSNPEKHVKMFFAARFNKAPKVVGCYDDISYTPGINRTGGTENGLVFTFPTKEGERIELQVSLSSTSTDNAWNNIKVETNELSFDEARIKAKSAWQNVLSKIKISGGTEEDKIRFYTGLYYALLGKGILPETNELIMSNENIDQIPIDKKNLIKEYIKEGLRNELRNISYFFNHNPSEYLYDNIQLITQINKETG